MKLFQTEKMFCLVNILSICFFVFTLQHSTVLEAFASKDMEVVSVQSVNNISSKNDTIKSIPGRAKLIIIRLNITEKVDELLNYTSLDFTIQYKYKSSMMMSQAVKPCDGIRWHGKTIDENNTWNLLPIEKRNESVSVGTTQISSGSDYLDLAFRIHDNAESISLMKTMKLSDISIEVNSDSAKFVSKQDASILPNFTSNLNGNNEVRVNNPNQFKVTVGLRSGKKGKDFEVSEHGSASVFVPDGQYQIYFVYSNKKDALFQGDGFKLKSNGIEIEIVKVVGGNYGIKRVK